MAENTVNAPLDCWLDRSGWRFPVSGSSGSWLAGMPTPEGLLQLIANHLGTAPLRVILSPELFFYFHYPVADGVLLMEKAQTLWGLVPGQWVFSSETVGDLRHVVCLPNPFAACLEQVDLVYPERIKWYLVPLRSPFAETAQTFRLGANGLQTRFDRDGTLEQWCLSPCLGRNPENSSRDELFERFLKPEVVWLCFQGKAAAGYRRLARWHRIASRALYFLLVPVMAIWGLLLWQSHHFQQRHSQAETTIRDHRDLGERLLAGRRHRAQLLEYLERAGTFSNRTKPVANAVVRLANFSNAGVRWQSLRIQGTTFRLQVGVDQVETLLTLFDKCQDQDPSIRIRFDRMYRVPGRNTLVVDLEGRLP